MKNTSILILAVATALILAGCETTNSIPYKASTTNIIAIEQNLSSQGKKVSVGTIEMAAGVEENPICRLMGPVVVAPGKTLPQYIKDAFIEELFAGKAYEVNAPTVIDARIDELKFSSITPADWKITMTVKSNNSPGYSVSVDYKFNTSWTAYSACKNVADAFGPAVQQLLHEVVTNPGFSKLSM